MVLRLLIAVVLGLVLLGARMAVAAPAGERSSADGVSAAAAVATLGLGHGADGGGDDDPFDLDGDDTDEDALLPVAVQTVFVLAAEPAGFPPDHARDSQHAGEQLFRPPA